jgi:type IV pilus assembly protein PilZ
MQRREHPRFPIRLAVRYPSARSLLGDYTRSISKGGVAIDSERNLDIGTEFVFEMSSPELPEPVEVHGKVVWTRPAGTPGKFTLGIQYAFEDADRRERLEKVIESILGEQIYERQRKYPRVPVSIEVHGARRVWVMRDLSRGGAMIQASTISPMGIIAGQRLQLALRVQQFDAVIDAEAVWVAQPFEVGPKQTVAGRFGVRFLDIEDEISEILEQIMRTVLQPERVNMTIRPIPKRGLD